MATADELRCVKKNAMLGDVAWGNSRMQAFVKKRFDKELIKLEARQKLQEKLDKSKHKEEPKPVTEEDKIKSIIQTAWSQTGCKESTKKISSKKKEISLGWSDADDCKNEKPKSKFTAAEEKAIFNYVLDLAQNSANVTLRTIRSEVYKFGKTKDIRDIFEKANKTEIKRKDWLYTFLKFKQKSEKKVVKF